MTAGAIHKTDRADSTTVAVRGPGPRQRSRSTIISAGINADTATGITVRAPPQRRTCPAFAYQYPATTANINNEITNERTKTSRGSPVGGRYSKRFDTSAPSFRRTNELNYGPVQRPTIRITPESRVLPDANLVYALSGSLSQASQNVRCSSIVASWSTGASAKVSTRSLPVACRPGRMT